METNSSRSALVVEIPEAEVAVGAHRLELDDSAKLGVPAHVTVLFPFVPPVDLDDRLCARLAEVFSAVPAFDYRFDRTAWFDEDVLWLASADPRPFVALTHVVHAAFPGHPPYAGEFEDLVPHLTVGHTRSVDRLRAAEAAVTPALPVVGRAERVSLLVQDGGRWQRASSYRLDRDRP